MKSDRDLWLQLCCRTGGLEYVYGSDGVPSLNCVEIQSICFNFGEELDAQLSFITREMPRQLPEKWRQRGVNAVRIVLDLINVCVNSFTPQCNSKPSASISIVEVADGWKDLRISCHGSGEEINLHARFVAVSSVSGVTVDDD